MFGTVGISNSNATRFFVDEFSSLKKPGGAPILRYWNSFLGSLVKNAASKAGRYYYLHQDYQ